MGVLTCLITSARADMANVGETVDISLKGREQNDSAITSLSHGVKLGLPRVWVANGIDLAIFNCVIPLLGKKDLPKDQYGLNGYRSQKVALSLSGKNIVGIGQLPILTPDDTCKMNREFVLVYTGNDEQPEDAQPIDSEDTGLDEDPAETEDLVHKV
jgi:hypothetical protein